MARFFTEADLDLSVIRSSPIAVLGFGSQGRSQALNLRDSGLDVQIGLYEGSSSWAAAEADGFRVASVEDVVLQVRVIAFCVPDVKMRRIYEGSVLPHLRHGQALLFAHGFNIHYGLIAPPSGLDVILVSPKGAGPGVRRTYEDGLGVPALIAVEQDASREALQIALGYAWGLGSARVLLMETSFREETETDLFGEQAVLCGGIPELIKAGFEVLVESGYQPQAAYFECLHETKLIVDLLYARGLTGLRERISDTAEWGGFLSGPKILGDEAKDRMRAVLAAIQDGSFAADWIREDAAGRPHLSQLRAAEAELEVEQVGRELRRAMRLQE